MSRDYLEDQMEFSIEFLGLGWAQLKLKQGVHSITHGFTYLNDAPRDLIKGLISLLQNESEVHCLWESEPAIYRWTFENTDEVVTLWIKCHSEGNFNPNNIPQFECIIRVSLLELSTAIVSGFRDILSDIGPDGYERKWHAYPFPMEDLLQAEDMLHNQSQLWLDNRLEPPFS